MPGAHLSPRNPAQDFRHLDWVTPAQAVGGLTAAAAPDADSQNGVVALEHTSEYTRGGVSAEYTATAYFRTVDRDDGAWSDNPLVCGEDKQGSSADVLDGIDPATVDISVVKPSGYTAGQLVPVCEGSTESLEWTLTNKASARPAVPHPNPAVARTAGMIDLVSPAHVGNYAGGRRFSQVPRFGGSRPRPAGHAV